MNYWTYVIIITLLAVLPQIWVNNAYNKYSKIKVSNGKTGELLVRDMLTSNGIYNVSINRIGGILTDHYNSKNKSINLSNDNFMTSSIASVAIAAHETGHAIQDNKGYVFLKLRQGLSSFAIVASNISWIGIYLGFLLLSRSLILFGIVALGVILLFNIVTLPVEINASRRAKQYLLSAGTYTMEEMDGVSKVLTAAAFTYIASTLAGLLQIIRLIGIIDRD